MFVYNVFKFFRLDVYTVIQSAKMDLYNKTTTAQNKIKYFILTIQQLCTVHLNFGGKKVLLHEDTTANESFA